MRKLTLRIDDLTVDSFQTSLAHPSAGTAHGHAATVTPPDDTGPLCPGQSGDCSYHICPAGVHPGTDDAPGYVTGTCRPVCMSIQFTQCIEDC